MTIQQYKAVVCDVDGTILDRFHKVPDKLIEVVSQLQSQGIIFTLASARPTLSMLQLAGELKLDVPVIALNGSMIIDKDAKIFHNQQFLAAKLSELFISFPDLLINAYSDFDWIVNRHDESVSIEANFVAINPIVSTVLPEKINMLVIIDKHHKLLEIQKYIYLMQPELSAVFSAPNYLHIAGAKTNKATGLVEFASLFNLSLNEIMAFGDGENDLAMLQSVGHGVAMENASDNVKSVADDIAKSNINLGVVEYLTNYYKLHTVKI